MVLLSSIFIITKVKKVFVFCYTNLIRLKHSVLPMFLLAFKVFQMLRKAANAFAQSNAKVIGRMEEKECIIRKEE